jgi:hypothetical protein
MATGARTLILALTLAGAALAGPWVGTTEGQTNLTFPGVYIQEVSVTPAGGSTARGAATLLTPVAEVGRTGSAVVLEVQPGPLQQALARFQRQGLALEASIRGRDAEGRAMEWRLENVLVSSYGRGSARSIRFVLEPAPPEPEPRKGKVEYTWKVEEGTKYAGLEPDPARISPATRERWVEFWSGLPAARAATLERGLRATGARAGRGQSTQTDWDFVLRAHPDLARLATALQRELGIAPPEDGPAEWRWIAVPICTITSDGPNCYIVVVPCAC